MICPKCDDPEWLHTGRGCVVIKDHDGKSIRTGKQCKCKLTEKEVVKLAQQAGKRAK